MRKSITTRYFYSTAILLLASTAFMGLIQMYLAMGYFRTDNDASLINTVDNTVRVLQEAQSASDDREQRLEIIKRETVITSRASGSLIFISDAYGRIVLCSAEDPEQYLALQLPEKALSEAFNAGQYTEVGTLDGILHSRYYVAGKPIEHDSRLAGFVFAASNADSLGDYMANLFSIFILSAGLMLMVASILSIVLTTRMTTPLRRISEAARKFGQGDFSIRVPVEGDDELAQMAVTFNNMAQNLEKIDQSRSNFMGNIAHELRTPMTTVKGFVDGMLDGTIPPESRHHYLEIVSQEVGRLTRLIKNMLDITKLEAGEYTVNATDYDVWESITGVVFSAEQRLEANRIQLAGFAPTRTMVYADKDLVYQVIYNIMDNAIKFTPEGGEIRFSVAQSKGFVTVAIRNTGAGIAPEALPYVFDRFYKEDKSRGLNTTGSGLGLHICKVLINLSGGSIRVDSQEGAWCQFSFTLPTPPQQNGKGQRPAKKQKPLREARPDKEPVREPKDGPAAPTDPQPPGTDGPDIPLQKDTP